ncbi:MAG: sulfotransferase [Leptolyngbya sp. SIO3F4]|nr:sulfotransferase [Leptolyngbya sp. SIO3F4]
MNKSSPKQVLFILGTAHTGSTLLSLMLGSHNQIFAVGELSNLAVRCDKGKPICDICEGGCNFWNHQFSPIEQQRLADCLQHQRLHRFIPLRAERSIRGLIGNDKIFRPYTSIFSKLPKATTTLVDSTKTVYWITLQLQLPEFQRNNPKSIKPKLLHLVKDGRAVMASYLRRQPNLNVEKLSQKWSQRVTASQQLFSKFPETDRLRIAYEDLATEPESTLQEICDFLGVEFTPALMCYWENDHHFISGNTGTRSLVQKYRQKSKSSKTSHRDYKLYAEEVGFQIKLDLRWKNELSSEQLDVFDQVAGEVNKPYAWNKS